jgi:hypothetical protein
MTTTPDNWVDEDRPEIVEQIVDGMISEMTFETLRQYVWDSLYDELIFQEWADIWIHAEQYAPELIEKFDAQPNASF